MTMPNLPGPVTIGLLPSSRHPVDGAFRRAAATPRHARAAAPPGRPCCAFVRPRASSRSCTAPSRSTYEALAGVTPDPSYSVADAVAASGWSLLSSPSQGSSPRSTRGRFLVPPSQGEGAGI